MGDRIKEKVMKIIKRRIPNYNWDEKTDYNEYSLTNDFGADSIDIAGIVADVELQFDIDGDKIMEMYLSQITVEVIINSVREVA